MNLCYISDIQTEELIHCDNPKLPHENVHDTNTSSCDQSDAEVSTETPDSSELDSDFSDSDFSDSDFSDSDFSNSVSSSSEGDHDQLSNKEKPNVEMCLLSCFLRYNFSASSSKDVLCTMQKVFPECKSLGNLNYEKLWGFLDADFASEVHYCECAIEFFLTIQMLTYAGNVGVHDTRQAIQLTEQNKHVRASSLQMLKDSWRTCCNLQVNIILESEYMGTSTSLLEEIPEWFCLRQRVIDMKRFNDCLFRF